MIELLDDLAQNPFQFLDVHDHAGDRIHRPLDRYLQSIVMPVAMGPETLAEKTLISRDTQFRLVVPVTG